MRKINKGAHLPDQWHVIRHVPWARLLKDEDDNVLGFLPEAFELRPHENAISVNSLEYFEGDHATRTKKAIQGLRTTKNIGKKSAFGIGNVGTIKEVCKKHGSLIKIVYAPSEDNPSHSLIRHLPKDKLPLLDALAKDAFCELVHNADIEEEEGSE